MVVHASWDSRTIKVIFDSKSDVFYIIKNKRKLLQCNAPISSINISTDRILYQREAMKKLREELSQRTSKGEMDLKIKFINSVPTIDKKIGNWNSSLFILNLNKLNIF